jgi:hypothetical protein
MNGSRSRENILKKIRKAFFLFRKVKGTMLFSTGRKQTLRCFLGKNSPGYRVSSYSVWMRQKQ